MTDQAIRLPAEWDDHEASWIFWNLNPENFHEKTSAIEWSFAEIVRIIAQTEKVRIIVADSAQLNKTQAVLKITGANIVNTEYLVAPFRWGWMRDAGPQFIQRGGQVEIVDFQFNAWANYEGWENDDQIPRRIAERYCLPRTPAIYANRHWVLEGGAIDTNGEGVLLTTEECLLDERVQVRNSGFSRADNEKVLREYLGVNTVIWAGKGLSGDDTHGHVDDLCRFVKARTVVAISEKNPRDENYSVLAENLERLRAWRFSDGGKLEVVELPTPQPVIFNGQRLPASYANFYICNGAVLTPIFNDPNDWRALGAMRELFPDRMVTGIYTRDLIMGGGSIHCLTMQQPKSIS